ncbi:hypothetical protein HYS28_02935 [Candidatus Uhrbacteria bacterium]|nr:hypothetical protein [Candidatus Uhrbacteria bacterium]
MQPERVEVTPPQRPVFSREQKVGYAVVVGCGVLSVVLGFLYMGRHLNAPFQITYTGNQMLTSDERLAQQIAEQKRSDTDGDTINDYDELYVYKSSPYLTDTDSDGLSDDIEINDGGDPTCATGDSCEDASDDIGQQETFADEYAAAAAEENARAVAAIEAMKESLRNVSPAEVRVMLVDSGATQAEVDAMTDEQVMATYEEILNQLEASGQLDQLLGAASSDMQAQ